MLPKRQEQFSKRTEVRSDEGLLLNLSRCKMSFEISKKMHKYEIELVLINIPDVLIMWYISQ